jgi:hypothetical protein
MQEAVTRSLTHFSVGPLMPLLLRHVSQQLLLVLVQGGLVSRQSIIASHSD